MRTTNALIAKFRSDLGSSSGELGAEQSEHVRAVADILESYLRYRNLATLCLLK